MLPIIWRNRGSLVAPTADDLFDRFLYGWPNFDRDADIAWSPRVDVRENDKEITIDVELPGIDKKDVKVEVKDNTLSISGERKGEKKTKDNDYCRIERHYGKFERTFSLPDTVLSDKTSAEYKDGVLTLTLPKSEKALPKEISIDVK
jgi:HSP20 family protein